jgi:NTE family protein
MTAALVLGGGGVAGIAWEAGIIDGLRQAGVDLTTADLIVGTSAGSVVGTLIAQDADLEQAITERASRPGPELKPDWDAAMRALGVLADSALDARQTRRAIGQLAIEAQTGPQEPWVEAISTGLPSLAWPSRPLLITAVDARTGEFAIWDRGSGIPLDLAIAASCAVPCVITPVSMNGSRYMDGGVPSGTNADLAVGASAVVVLDPLAHTMPEDRVAAELTSTGASATTVVGPDQPSVDSFGADLLDQNLWLPAFTAGRTQAVTIAPQVAKVWGTAQA